jgi:hypothetical protein
MTRGERIGVLSLAVVCGAAYLIYMCPGLNWQDSGHLTAGAFGLGVAHPPGFPVYILLAKLATFIPFGSIAFRVNLLSGICAVGSAVMCYRLILKLIGNTSPASHASALSAALVLALGQTYWLHATTTEVYAPNLLALLVLLWFLIHSAEQRSYRSMRIAAVVTGLGVGLHPSFVVMAIVGWAFLLIRWAADERRNGRPMGPLISRFAGWTLALSALAAAVLAYLPIRAAAEPWLNWGNPSSFSGFWEHLTGASVRQAFADDMGALELLPFRVDAAMEQLAIQVSWVGLVAPVGLVWLVLKKRSLGLFLFALWLADLAFSTLINPMAIAELQTGLITTTITVILVGVGASVAGPRMAKEFRPRVGGALLGIALVGLGMPAMLSGGTVRDNRRLYMPTDLADMTLDSAVPNALFLLHSDDLASTTLYMQGVENRRPDVTAVIKQFVDDPRYLRHIAAFDSAGYLTTTLAAVDSGSAVARQRLVHRLARDASSRGHVYWELGLDDSCWIRSKYRAGFPMGRLFGDVPSDLQLMTSDFRRRWLELGQARARHPTADIRLARMYSQLSVNLHKLSEHLNQPGQFEESRRILEQARRIAEEVIIIHPKRTESKTLNRYGGVLLAHANMRRTRGAELLREGNKNRGEADLFKAGKEEKLAENAYIRATIVNPTDVSGWYNAGRTRIIRLRKLQAVGPEDIEFVGRFFFSALALNPKPSTLANIAELLAEFNSRVGDAPVAFTMLRTLRNTVEALFPNERKTVSAWKKKLDRAISRFVAPDRK